ncbi:MAG: Outer membrane porin F precursor [Alphaproteobacteria bacterium ADurb.BinA280]|jgi:outer membrane protein OmpA-like peptidoglycan-associated protein|nr:OmpA family protein [Aquimonas sp.]OPZ14015.1 MAG: Outer membrane porin F precursor [Alphaproteobacteria bacterium ADurb.BinA280]
MNALRNALLLLLWMAPLYAAPRPDPELEALQQSLAELEADPSLGGLAAGEVERARQAVQTVAETAKRKRPEPIFLAQRRIAIARAVAERELAERQLAQLEREHDRILLQAAQREAEAARREAESLRLLSLTRAEETERALQIADAARVESELSMAEAEASRRVADAQAEEAALARREAELAAEAAESLRLQLNSMTARRDARGQVMTLSGDAFASGGASLRPEADANLQRVIQFVQGQPTARVLIEGHTDSQGSANLNQVLSQKRAEAVRDALIAAGVEAGRLRALGSGEDRPIDDNSSNEGRARNRRVEIVLEQGQ